MSIEFSKNESFEIYIKRVMDAKEKGFFAGMLRFFLFFFSCIYKGAIKARNYAFDKQWLPVYVPPVPLVISIGNIVAGGTGKTPVTLFLADFFQDNFQVAILSRGYKSKAEKLSHPILVDPIFHHPHECGDEPFLLAKRLPNSLVFSGPNRLASSHAAAKYGVDVIILDDGLQNRRIARDFDIVVIDSRDPFGLGHYLPRGLLRDDIKSLRRAHIIILNNIKNKEDFDSLKQRVSTYSGAPIVGSQLYLREILDKEGNVIHGLEGKKIGAFCGIAHPEYFFDLLDRLGCTKKIEWSLPDHGKIDPQLFLDFAKKSIEQNCDFLVCTEKDYVRIPNHIKEAFSIVYLKMDLAIDFNKELWFKFLETTKEKIIGRK